MLITPIWPITTLAGNCERAFAATMTDGAKNEDPKPAIMKVIERMASTSVLLEGPIKLTATIPTMKDTPDNKDARTTKKSIL